MTDELAKRVNSVSVGLSDAEACAGANLLSDNDDPGGSRTRDLRIKRSSPVEVSAPPHSAGVAVLGVVDGAGTPGLEGLDTPGVSELCQSEDAEPPSSRLTNSRRSVLQDWVMELPLREQGTLMTAVRGCDLAPKYPLNSIERRLTAAIRGAFLVPADPREVDSEPGSFMSRMIPIDIKPSTLGHYPLHWVMHVMHASEVLGYRHPDETSRLAWECVYTRFCTSLHLPVEDFDAFEARMVEDRIELGTVVS